MRSRKNLGKVIYQEHPNDFYKYKGRLRTETIVVFIVWLIVFVLLDLSRGGFSIYQGMDRVILFFMGIFSIFFIVPFYFWLTSTPFQIFENGFVWVTGRFIYYKNIKKVDLEYIQKIMEEKKYTGIKIKIKGWLFPRIIGFDDPSVIPFIRYALLHIKKHGGKIMFTKEELKRTLKKYKIDTSFIDEIPVWEEEKQKY